jgi:hypothetical protein
MNFVKVDLREGQTLQCAHCLQMKGEPIWADLNGTPYQAYYCADCVETVKHGNDEEVPN